MRLKYCYVRQLSRTPKLSGTITVKIRIGRNGKVIDSSISSSTMGSKQVESCLLQIIDLMNFPESKDGIVMAKYAFIFEAE